MALSFAVDRRDDIADVSRAVVSEKSKALKDSLDFTGFEDGNRPHGSADLLRSDELGFQARRPIFEQHVDHFAKIGRQLVERFTLRMRTRESRHVANKKPSFNIALDHGDERRLIARRDAS